MAASTSLTAAERRARAQIAANARWGKEPDRLGATKPGRDAAWQKLLHEADPEGILSDSERLKRAKNLQQEQMARIRFLASKVRKCRAGLDVVPEAVPADAGGGA